jgi:hypothetical protein
MNHVGTAGAEDDSDTKTHDVLQWSVQLITGDKLMLMGLYNAHHTREFALEDDLLVGVVRVPRATWLAKSSNRLCRLDFVHNRASCSNLTKVEQQLQHFCRGSSSSCLEGQIREQRNE